MDAENKDSCSQRDSAERKGYVRAHRSFNRIWKERDSAEPDILGKILDKDNLNRAYKRVKANKGAPGVDGMTIEQALPWLKEHNHELTERIRKGHYTPSPVRRAEIPKSDGGVRKLGIPTVTDRIIQQAITQQLMPIFEPLFSDGSYGYRPGRSAKDAIQKIKEYAEKGYTRAVVLDLSKYFDTLNHELLINILRRNVKDERVIQMIKRYLKSGVMENGVVMETEEGSPQGGNISPLLANIYLNEFDQEFSKRGVPCIRYADDIVLLAKSRCGSIVGAMKRIEVYMRGWLNYYGIASMKNNIENLNGWLYRRIRMCIWKQWKLPRTRKRKLLGLGLPEWVACEGAYSRKAYWRMANSGVVKRALTKERLIHWGFYDLATAYQSMHVNY